MKPPELIETILKLSRADDCIVIMEETSSVNVRWANNTTTTNGAASGQELIIIAIRDKRVGMVHRSFIDAKLLEGLVLEAEAACDFQEVAEDYAPLVASGKKSPNWGVPAPSTDMHVLGDVVRDLATAFRQAAADNLRFFGYVEHSSSAVYVANSRGLRRRYDLLKGQVEITAKTADFETSAWVGQATKDFDDIDVPAMIRRLRQRLEWSKTKLDLPAGAYDTLLEPSAVADLLIYAYWSSAARDAAEGRTVFSKTGGKTRIGERLGKSQLTIYSDPHEPGLEVADFEIVAGSSSYASVFDNGFDLKRTDWIEQGVLRQLITPRYLAAQKRQEAAPYIDNLIMATDSTADLDELVRGMKRGLLVTCLWYIREVDAQRLLLTGLTRDGVFLVEDGKVRGVVNNFRFNMSPVEMLEKIDAVGMSVPTLPREWGDYFTFAKVPPIIVKDFNMSSVSQAT